MTEQTIRLTVESMKCNGCVKTIENTLNDLEEVSTVTVNLQQKSVEVRTSETGSGVDKLIQVLDEAGYKAQQAA